MRYCTSKMLLKEFWSYDKKEKCISFVVFTILHKIFKNDYEFSYFLFDYVQKLTNIHCILLHALKNDPSIAFSILNSMSSTQGSILKEKIFKLKFPSLSFLLLSEKYLKEIASIIFYLCQKSVFKIGVIIHVD